MLKLIAGKKGSGKTKQLVSMVNDAVEKSDGKVVCIEKSGKLTFDISHDVRLISSDEYLVSGCDAFYGLIAGIAASDFDVKEIYVDSVAKITGDDLTKIAEMFNKINQLSLAKEINIVMTLSRDSAEFPREIAKYVLINLQ